MFKKILEKHLIERTIILLIGLYIMSLGIAFSIKASLGTSPISSVPYVTSCISGLSVGETTIIINLVFILTQILLLRKKYNPLQLFQIPALILFGIMIDISGFDKKYHIQQLFSAMGIMFYRNTFSWCWSEYKNYG
nr:DUF6198 family protein [Brachyspira innocens]